MTRTKGTRAPYRQSPERPTVRRPWVDLAPFVKRVELRLDDKEAMWVDADTGLIVYATPCGPKACDRARTWARRNHFVYNAADQGRWQRSLKP